MNLSDFFNRASTIPVRFVKEFEETIADDIFEILEEQQKDIFDSERGPLSEGFDLWPKISVISLLVRETKPSGAPYSDVSDMFRDRNNTKPLKDSGELLDQLTDQTRSKGIREVKFSNGLKLIFGSHKGRIHQEGGDGDPLTGEQISRAESRLVPNSSAFLFWIKSDKSGGEIPQRKFLFLEKDTFEMITNKTFEHLVTNLEDLFT